MNHCNPHFCNKQSLEKPSMLLLLDFYKLPLKTTQELFCCPQDSSYIFLQCIECQLDLSLLLQCFLNILKLFKFFPFWKSTMLNASVFYNFFYLLLLQLHIHGLLKRNLLSTHTTVQFLLVYLFFFSMWMYLLELNFWNS